MGQVPIPEAVKHTFWVTDAEMRDAGGDMYRWIEEIVENDMLAYVATRFGLSYNNMADFAHHVWWDMDDPAQVERWFGPQTPDNHVIPPARWMLYSEWEIKYPIRTPAARSA